MTDYGIMLTFEMFMIVLRQIRTFEGRERPRRVIAVMICRALMILHICFIETPKKVLRNMLTTKHAVRPLSINEKVFFKNLISPKGYI